jgi:hypothetical protein
MEIWTIAELMLSRLLSVTLYFIHLCKFSLWLFTFSVVVHPNTLQTEVFSGVSRAPYRMILLVEKAQNLIPRLFTVLLGETGRLSIYPIGDVVIVRDKILVVVDYVASHKAPFLSWLNLDHVTVAAIPITRNGKLLSRRCR